MQYSNIFVILFVAGTTFDFLLNQVLELVDYIHRKKHGTEVPRELEGHIDAETLSRTCAYEDAKYFLWIPSNILRTALTYALVLSGFYVWLYESLWSLCGNTYLAMILFMIISAVPSTVISVPFSLVREFRVEKKFGFSTMTFSLWLLDQVKSLVLGLVLSVPLLCAAIALVTHASSWWWILLGAVYVAFSLIVSFVYPIWIAPLFNKFTPVEDGELKSRLEALLEKTGFKAKSMFIMDASKRSRHSNAYFTGFGKNKRIVLYDTLVNQLSTDEIEAVLAHELGHYKKKHILRRYCVTFPLIFVVLGVLSMLVKIPALYEGFGFTLSPEWLSGDGMFSVCEPHLIVIGMYFAALSFEGFAPFVEVVANVSSRRDEFQADAFSAGLCGSGEPLVTSLIKLNRENLSEVTVPKIYSIVNYSHPPLLERIKALRG